MPITGTFTIWHYKFSIYYKFVIVIDLVYAQHVTEEHYTLNEGKVAAYKLVFLYVHLSLGFFSKRQLTFTFALCRRASVCRLSVCLSVTFMHPTQAIHIFCNIFISYERAFILVF